MLRGELLKGLGWLSLSVVSWGGLFSVAKRTLPVLDPYFLGSIRYVLGAGALIALLWIAEGRQALRYNGRFLPAAVAGLFGYCSFNVLVWLGLVYTRPEHASLIMVLQTPMIALWMWLMRGARPSPFTGACIAFAIAGVLLVVTKGDLSQVTGGSLLGDVIVFAGAVSWVVYTLMSTRFAGWSPLRMTVLTCIPGTVCLVAVNAFTIAAGFSSLPSPETVLSVKWQILYFVVFTVVLGLLGFNNGVKYLGPLNAMLTLNLIPIVVFGVEIALGRSFSAIEIGGAALVVCALTANNLHLRRSASQA